MYEFMEGIPEAMDAAGNVIFYNISQGTGYSIKCLLRDWPRYQNDSGDGETRVHIRARYSEQKGYTLFGFIDISDRTAFDLLTKVKGVAGTGAMAIIEVYRIPELAARIRAGDVKGLSKAKGIGPKVATQIIAELVSKIDDVQGDAIPVSMDREKAIDALVALGYKRPAVVAAMTELNEDTVDAYIRKTIAALM